jgi:hypothetical protein
MILTDRSCAGSSYAGGFGCVKTPYDKAIDRVKVSEEDMAAPIVPEDNTNAEDVFRPRLGPDMTKSMEPG